MKATVDDFELLDAWARGRWAMTRRFASVVVVVVVGCAASEPMGEGTTGGGSATATGSASESASESESESESASASGSASESGSASASSSSSSSGGDTGSARLPSEVLDLANWKLTLPVGSREEPDAPREVLQPELADFMLDPYFVLDGSATAVVFRAHAGGVTTDNSGYPRSELREMTADGVDEIGWATSTGTHTMTIEQAITHLPEVKPHVVAGQIHDAEDDVVMIRLEGEHLFVEGGGEELGDLEAAYVLGTVFTVVLAAHDGMIDVYYEDLATPVVSIARDVDGCYFKAGAYTQSNEEQGDAPEAYGEVVIHDLVVEHVP